MTTPATPSESPYPARLSVDRAERLDRLSSALRMFWIIPIGIVYSVLSATVTYTTYRVVDDRVVDQATQTSGGITGALFTATLLMILFRQRYPRWWFDFLREFTRFGARVLAYAALLTDRYPATEEEQSVHLELDFPEARTDLNRWLPLVKWFLAIPHYVVLFFLWIGAVAVVVIAWFAILFTGRYPAALFDYVVGVGRWSLRVSAYAFFLITDRYPPFSLE